MNLKLLFKKVHVKGKECTKYTAKNVSYPSPAVIVPPPNICKQSHLLVSWTPSQGFFRQNKQSGNQCPRALSLRGSCVVCALWSSLSSTPERATPCCGFLDPHSTPALLLCTYMVSSKYFAISKLELCTTYFTYKYTSEINSQKWTVFVTLIAFSKGYFF